MARKVSRRLVVLFDGTSNTPKDRTNVHRTCELLSATDAKGVPQLKKYIEGVGTDVGFIARGSIFGEGVVRRIRDAYAWLVDHHVPGAEIYVFGFSRGAFSARSLVQLISCCGLTRPEARERWTASMAFAHYEEIAEENAFPIWKLRYWQKNPTEAPRNWQPGVADRILMDNAAVQVVKVKMAGLWDTVGAIGKDALKNHGSITQKSAMHNVRPTKAQLRGYHAIAIDEHRPMFDVTLWRTFVPAGEKDAILARYAKYYEQRWFIGAHSDVGGGYDDDRLPDYSLAWMLGKASSLGLAFRKQVTPQPDGWKAPIHDSFRKFAGGVLNIWDKVKRGDQRVYREIGRTPKEAVTAEGKKGELISINETIDESVLLRWKNDPKYRPKGLEEYFRRNPTLRP